MISKKFLVIYTCLVMVASVAAILAIFLIYIPRRFMNIEKEITSLNKRVHELTKAQETEQSFYRYSINNLQSSNPTDHGTKNSVSSNGNSNITIHEHNSEAISPEERYQTIRDKYISAGYDYEWSTRAEESIVSTYNAWSKGEYSQQGSAFQNSSPGFTLQDVECKKNTCMVNVKYNGNEPIYNMMDVPRLISVASYPCAFTSLPYNEIYDIHEFYFYCKE